MADGSGRASGTIPTISKAATALKGSEHGKQAPPTDICDDDVGRRGRRDGSQGPQHDEPAIGERQALGRKPQHDGFEAGHQRQGDTDADQRAAQQQANQTVGQREHQSAGAGQQQEAALQAARAVAVEQDAKRDLGGGKHQKVDRRQQSEVGGIEAELGGQVGGDQGIDGAKQIGQVIAGCERQQNAADPA